MPTSASSKIVLSAILMMFVPGSVQQRFNECLLCARTEISTKGSKVIKIFFCSLGSRGPTLYPGAIFERTVSGHGIYEGLRNSSFKMKMASFQ